MPRVPFATRKLSAYLFTFLLIYALLLSAIAPFTIRNAEAKADKKEAVTKPFKTTTPERKSNTEPTDPLKEGTAKRGLNALL
jgi:hypothetical protein